MKVANHGLRDLAGNPEVLHRKVPDDGVALFRGAAVKNIRRDQRLAVPARSMELLLAIVDSSLVPVQTGFQASRRNTKVIYRRMIENKNKDVRYLLSSLAVCNVLKCINEINKRITVYFMIITKIIFNTNL